MKAKTRTRTIQALSCATIAGTIWMLWDTVSLTYRLGSGDGFTELFPRWFIFRLGLDFAASVMAGVIAIRMLLKRRKASGDLCCTTGAMLVMDMCFHWKWMYGVLWNLRTLALQWSDRQFGNDLQFAFAYVVPLVQYALAYIVPLVLVAFLLSDKTDSGGESGRDGETLDKETKTRYGILHGFLLSVSIGLWIGAAQLSSSRFGGVTVLALGIGLGIAWVIWLRRRARGFRAGLAPLLLTAFVRSIADLFSAVKHFPVRHFLWSPLPPGWWGVCKSLAGLLFTCCAFVAICLWGDASKVWNGEARLLLCLSAFEWVFYGMIGALHLWAVASLFSNILNTRRILGRIRFPNNHASDGKELPPFGRMDVPPTDGGPNRLGGWATVCRILAAICIVLLLPACIVAVFAGDSGVSRAGGIGIPFVLVAVFWWKMWATIFRKQDESSVKAWSVTDSFAAIKDFSCRPLPFDWGLVCKILACLLFACCAFVAGLERVSSKVLNDEARFLLWLASFEWVFYGMVGALHLWAVASLFSNILSTRQYVARIRFANNHASDGKELPPFGGMDVPPTGGGPNRLGGWATVCQILAVICIVLLLPACIVAVFAGDSDVSRAGGIGIPFALVAFFWWETWATLFRKQDEASVEARTMEQWMVVSNSGVFDSDAEQSAGSPVCRRRDWKGDFLRGLLGLVSIVLFAHMGFGVGHFWVSETRANAVSRLIESMIQLPGRHFMMGKCEVTQAQWVAVMGANPSYFKGADLPVEYVSWDDCQEFLWILNALPSVKESGLTFRLPTEEEWEYACRARAMGEYCKLTGGTEITERSLRRVAWFWDNADYKTHPVGQKEPNAFGLYDMHGNVGEWTSTADGECRVNRGGGWICPAGGCESSKRYGDSPCLRSNALGFRLCAERRAD